jgi:hypothetical protein
MKRALATLLLLTLLTSGGGKLMAAQRPLPALASTPSPDLHYDLQARVYFQNWARTFGRALVWGSVEPDAIIYRVNVVYSNNGYVEPQIIGR